MEAVEQILGLKKKIRSTLDFVELSKEGVSKTELSNLAKHLNVGLQKMAELISINARTIQRYTGQKVFSQTVSEHILRIAVVTVRGDEVFGNKERFRAWLNLPNKALGNKKPFDLLASDFGIDMVFDELGRLEHGIVS
jgi:putative toxin-antitoxin system antitoxin component (TIGR02293 family)